MDIKFIWDTPLRLALQSQLFALASPNTRKFSETELYLHQTAPSKCATAAQSASRTSVLTMLMVEKISQRDRCTQQVVVAIAPQPDIGYKNSVSYH